MLFLKLFLFKQKEKNEMLVCMFIGKRRTKVKKKKRDKIRNEAISSVFQNDFMDHS